MEKITKRQMYTAMINYANGEDFAFETEDGMVTVTADEIVAFAENEITLLDKKAAKAKETAAKKKTESDALMDAVAAALGEDFEPIADIAARIEGDDVTVIATGSMVNEAIKAHDVLKNEGISVRIIDMHTIKPIDKDIIIKAAKETKGIVTAEEHSIIGGLGGAVCEVVAENWPTKVLRVGVNDKFGKSGNAGALLKEYGLTAENIIENVKRAMEVSY